MVKQMDNIMTFIPAYALTLTCYVLLKQLTKTRLLVLQELKPKLSTKAGSLTLTILLKNSQIRKTKLYFCPHFPSQLSWSSF